MTDFIVKTLERHITQEFASRPPQEVANRHQHFVYYFTGVPGRRFTNKFGVWANRLVVNLLQHDSSYDLILCLHDATRKLTSSDGDYESKIVRGNGKELSAALEKLLQRFSETQECKGCGRLVTDKGNQCLDCTLLSNLGRPAQNCAICQEETDLYATLPCGHHYHMQCLGGMETPRHECECDEDHTQSLSCPQCRRVFTLPLDE